MGCADLSTGRVCFWNSHGSSNVSDIEKIVNYSDVLCICETWLMSANIVLSGVLHNFNYICSPASRIASHGRASGIYVYKFRIFSSSYEDR